MTVERFFGAAQLEAEVLVAMRSTGSPNPVADVARACRVRFNCEPNQMDGDSLRQLLSELRALARFDVARRDLRSPEVRERERKAEAFIAEKMRERRAHDEKCYCEFCR